MQINIPRIRNGELLFTYLMKLAEANAIDFNLHTNGNSYGGYITAAHEFMNLMEFDSDAADMMLQGHTAINVLNLILRKNNNPTTGLWTDYRMVGCPDCISEFRDASDTGDSVLNWHNLPGVTICKKHKTPLRFVLEGAGSAFDIILEDNIVKPTSLFKQAEYASFMRSLLEDYPFDKKPDATDTIHAVRTFIMDLGYYPDQMLYGGEYSDMSPLLFAMLWNRILKEDFPESVMRNLYYALCDLVDEQSRFNAGFPEDYYFALFSLFKSADCFYEFCFKEASDNNLITFGKYVGHASAVTERKLRDYIRNERNGTLKTHPYFQN